MCKEITVSFSAEMESVLSDMKEKSYPESTANEMITDLIRKGLSVMKDKPKDNPDTEKSQ